MAVEAAVRLWTEHRATDGLAIGSEAAAAAREALATVDVGAGDHSRLIDALLGALEGAFDGALQTEDLTTLDRIADEMIEVAPQAGTEAYLRALHYGGVAMRHLGRYRDAARRYREAWIGARQRTLPMLAIESGTGALLTLLRMGHLEEAREIADEVNAFYERMGQQKIHQVRPLRAVREVMLSTGDWRAALEALKSDLLDEADPHYRLSTHQLIAIWSSRIGRVTMAEDVERHIDAGRRDAAAAGCPRCAAEFHLRAAEALARVGQSDHAAELLETRRPTVQVHPMEHAYRLWIAGLGGGSSDEALASLTETLTRLTSLGLRLEEVWLRLDLAQALSPRDRPGRDRAAPFGDDDRSRRGRSHRGAPGRTGPAAPGGEDLAQGCVEARWRDSVRPDGSRGRDRPGRCGRRQQPRDRRAAIPVAADRRAPPLDDPAQARAPQPDGACLPRRSTRRAVRLRTVRLGELPDEPALILPVRSPMSCGG